MLERKVGLSSIAITHICSNPCVSGCSLSTASALVLDGVAYAPRSCIILYTRDGYKSHANLAGLIPVCVRGPENILFFCTPRCEDGTERRRAAMLPVILSRPATQWVIHGVGSGPVGKRSAFLLAAPGAFLTP